MARPILPYEPTPARIDVLSKDVGTTQDLGVAIGTEVRKTVNELEQSLARREQENLNLKILVRELEEERRAEDLSARLLNEAAVKVQSNWRSIDGAILQESQAFTRTPERAFRASASVDVQSMPRPPVQPANIFGSDPSLNHVGGSGQRDVDIKISRYHEETRDLRAQLNAVTTKLAQSEASCNLAAAQVEKADEQVLSLSRQLIELKSELELASRCRASDQVEILQLRKAREQMEAAHREREAFVVELREQRDRDAEAAREMSRQVDELKCRGERDVQEEGAREQQREAEYQRRQQVVERGHQAEIEELTRQNSEYRATLIQQEASIAELKTHLTRDSALVGQLRCRVEQQEGLLVEHSAQLCEKEAHIADLERELRQQQAWESLGAPALKPDRAPAAQGGCVGDAGGRGRGSGARGEVGAENEVVALDQHVLDLRADKVRSVTGCVTCLRLVERCSKARCQLSRWPGEAFGLTLGHVLRRSLRRCCRRSSRSHGLWSASCQKATASSSPCSKWLLAPPNSLPCHSLRVRISICPPKAWRSQGRGRQLRRRQLRGLTGAGRRTSTA